MIAVLIAGTIAAALGVFWWSPADGSSGAGQDSSTSPTELCTIFDQFLSQNMVAEAILLLGNVEEAGDCLEAAGADVVATINTAIATHLADAGLCDEAKSYDESVAEETCRTPVLDVALDTLLLVAVVGAAVIIVRLIGQSIWAVRTAIHPILGRAILGAFALMSVTVLYGFSVREPLKQGETQLRLIAWVIGVTAALDLILSLRRSRPRPGMSMWALGVGGVLAAFYVVSTLLSASLLFPGWPVWLALGMTLLLAWYGLTIVVLGVEPPVSLIPPATGGADEEEAALRAALSQLANSEPDGLDVVATPDDPAELDSVIALTGDSASNTLTAVAEVVVANARKTEYRMSWSRPLTGDASSVFVSLSRGRALVDSYEFELGDYYVPPPTPDDKQWDDERRRSLLFSILAVWALFSIERHFYGSSTIYGTSSWESAALTMAGAFWVRVDPDTANRLFERAVREAGNT